MEKTITEIPRGRIIIKAYRKAPLSVEISGEITPGDMQLILITARRAYAKHLAQIGEKNKIKAAEDKLTKETTNG